MKYNYEAINQLIKQLRQESIDEAREKKRVNGQDYISPYLLKDDE